MTTVLRLYTGEHIMGQEAVRNNVMQQKSICPRCGAYNILGQRFCAGCGAPLIMQCPHCSINISPASKFCPNCGMQFSQSIQQSTKEKKGKSGWAMFGMMLFILGILCLVAVPVIFLASSGNIGGSLIARAVIAGVINITVGLSLIRRG